MVARSFFIHASIAHCLFLFLIHQLAPRVRYNIAFHKFAVVGVRKWGNVELPKLFQAFTENVLVGKKVRIKLYLAITPSMRLHLLTIITLAILFNKTVLLKRMARMMIVNKYYPRNPPPSSVPHHPLVTVTVAGRSVDFWCRQSPVETLCNIAVSTMITTQHSGRNLMQPPWFMNTAEYAFSIIIPEIFSTLTRVFKCALV